MLSYSNFFFEYSEKSADLLDILNDMELILNSDPHFLLSNWVSDARLKATDYDERDLYELNARTQITLWGLNSTSEVLAIIFVSDFNLRYKLH